MSWVTLFVCCIKVRALHDNVTNINKVEQIRPIRKECQHEKNKSTDSHHCIILDWVIILNHIYKFAINAYNRRICE